MPHAPPGPCPVPGCSRSKAPGWPRCERHTSAQTREFNQRRDPALEAFYHSSAWQRLKAQVKAEQPRCPGWPAGSGCGKPTTDVDHITAMHDGGARLDRANLQALCSRCHDRKSGDERRRRARTG